VPRLALVAVVFALGAVPVRSETRPQASHPRQDTIAAFQANDLEEAERLSLAWLETHPRDEEIHRLLGMVRMTKGLALEARERPRSEYLAVYRQALAALLEAERLAGGAPRPDLHHAVGYVLMSEGRYPEAEARFDRAIGETPRNFVLYRLRGNCRLERGLYLEAEADLRRAVELNERDWTSRVLHARALLLVGKGQSAREGLRAYHRLVEAEATPETDFEVRYEIYRYSMLLNDTEAALADLEGACPLAPANVVCRTELGSLYYQLGQPERAIPELDAVLAAPAAPPAVQGDALYVRGMVAKQQEQHEAARRYLEESLQLNPTRTDALLAYGATLRALGEPEEARRALERFQEVAEREKELKLLTDRLLLDPSGREPRVELIGLLMELERWTEARKHLDELRRRHPGDAALPDLEARMPGG
jgi:tetratricopeptide (TPR) repeat protein